MAQHTPGPWKQTGDVLGPQRGAIYVEGPDGELIASLSWRDPATDEANARLAAAAPDMLEALRTTAMNLRSLRDAEILRRGNTIYNKWLAHVEAVIAAAEIAALAEQPAMEAAE